MIIDRLRNCCQYYRCLHDWLLIIVKTVIIVSKSGMMADAGSEKSNKPMRKWHGLIIDLDAEVSLFKRNGDSLSFVLLAPRQEPPPEQFQDI